VNPASYLWQWKFRPLTWDIRFIPYALNDFSRIRGISDRVPSALLSPVPASIRRQSSRLLTESPTPQTDALNGEQHQAETRTRHANEKWNIGLIAWSAKCGR
jgi:hypothetical protein